MKKIYIIVCILALLPSVCVFMILGVNKKESQSSELADSYFVNSELFGVLKWNIEKHYSFENKAISDFEITDTNNKTSLFSDLLEKENGKYKLVFYLSSTNCSSCIDSEMSSLQSFEGLIGRSNIVILAQYESIRQLRVFLASRNIDVAVYYVETNPFDVLKKENLPFSFVVDRNMTMELIFIPIKEIPSYSEMYYTTVYERFFKN